ncbi:MBL fold metallo-hydrolase [Bhargavaea ullalensis]|uniref:Glyoxylase-like metal-dependent hydrolase (Beta-lactamase superfamily II) n=1 Tax=Bhargavaea ullalensis TaxID=1265685 RepID=A0ABV2G9T5_9BACL
MLFKGTGVLGEQAGVQYCQALNKGLGVTLSCYAFETDGVLIDTGAHSLRRFFRPFIDHAQPDFAAITHYHEDHTGNAAYCADRGIPIYMSPLYAEDCSRRAGYPFYRQMFWGRRPAFQSEEMPETFSSRHFNWRSIETPGHAADHVSLLNESTGQLFSGDLFVSVKQKVALREENIPETIRSLEKILSYDFGEMFCCHAGYVENGRKKLEDKLEFLSNLRDEVLRLHGEGRPVKEIQCTLYPKTYPITRFSRGEWDSEHLITSILAEPDGHKKRPLPGREGAAR